MKKGISIYPGLDNTCQENLTLVRSAAKLGIRRIFTSRRYLKLINRTFQPDCRNF